MAGAFDRFLIVPRRCSSNAHARLNLDLHPRTSIFRIFKENAHPQARDAGKVTSVGVSNVGPAQIEGLRAAGCELPEVRRIDVHTCVCHQVNQFEPYTLHPKP